MLFCRLWITVGYLSPSETMASLLFSTCAFLWTPQPAITEQRSRPMEFQKKKKNTMEKFTFKKRDPKKKKDLEISVLLYWKQTKASSPKEKHKARLWKSLRTRLRTWPTAFLFLFYFHFFTIIIVIILYICFGGLTACFSAHERVFDHGTGLEQRDTRIHASIVSS